ncbi:MAG: hypothetical protein ACXVAP_03805, partial [Candidatus Limnocylindrales bacterium]
VNDPNLADNAASDTTTVLEAAALSVTKDDGLATVAAGTGGHAYTITVTNGGPSDADSVVLDDTVPPAFSAGTPSADLAGDCTGSVGNTIHCSLPASLAPGASWTITVPYSVGPAVPAQTVANTATATSAENPLGVAATDLTDVTPSATGSGALPTLPASDAWLGGASGGGAALPLAALLLLLLAGDAIHIARRIER